MLGTANSAMLMCLSRSSSGRGAGTLIQINPGRALPHRSTISPEARRQPEEMAEVIAFLASYAASYITCAAIVADGGTSMATGTSCTDRAHGGRHEYVAAGVPCL